jgi:hypothetical protein
VVIVRAAARDIGSATTSSAGGPRAIEQRDARTVMRDGRVIYMACKVEVEFDEFGWEALTDEARRQGVTLEELVVHAAMYYLADADRERFAHRVPRGRGGRVLADKAPRQA